MSVLDYTPREVVESAMRSGFREAGDELLRRAARPVALDMAAERDRRALEGRWLDEAYEVERAGNPRRMFWILDWARRL